MQEEKKVTISCGTKFHSDHVAYQLSKHNLLNKVLTSHPAKYYLNRVALKRGDVKFLPPVFLLAYGLRKILGSSNRITAWLNYRLPVVYDKMASLAVKNTDVLLTWAWSGLSTIRAVKKNGGIAIVEECGSFSRFQNEILAEEYKLVGLHFDNYTPQFIIDRQMKEAQLADYLLCPSNHVAASFIKYGIAKEKCRIIPYGANIKTFQPTAIEKKAFTILFVGTVGVRKGLIYLFRALELLKDKYEHQCIIIGGLEEQFKPVFNKYRHLFTYIPHVPHQELVTYYNQASVFVFPSIDEGMALVQLEALACGLPVICTPNSGGDAAIEEGIEGFIVPVRNHEKLAEKIRLLMEDRSLLISMAEKARAKALSFSWDTYGDRLSDFIKSITNKTTGVEEG